MRNDVHHHHHQRSPLIEQRSDTVRVRIRVQPRASRTEIVGEHGGVLKVRVAAPPVDGAANTELVRVIAKRLRVPTARVRVRSGDTSRSKVVEIDGVDAAAVRRALLG
jgi:uncharacterized protein (TIGR00251 family)